MVGGLVGGAVGSLSQMPPLQWQQASLAVDSFPFLSVPVKTNSMTHPWKAAEGEGGVSMMKYFYEGKANNQLTGSLVL